jgi:hypothetical protein
MPYRQLGALAALLMLTAGCAGESRELTPDLAASPAEVNLCFKELGSTYEWQGLQLENSGDADLLITNIEVRGDSSCAFRCFREAVGGESSDELHPCPQESEGGPTLLFQMTIPPGGMRFVTIEYTPSADDVPDSASLVITSDAESYLPEGANLGQAVVPLCGQGFEPGDYPGDDPDLDGGVECPVCEPPEPGAPGCEAGYPAD